ncbi:hypothetical protein KIPE111705_31985 [Kibdelosporangium persicum]
MAGEAFGLGVYAEVVVVQHDHGVGGVAPAGRFLGVHAQVVSQCGVGFDHGRGGAQVTACHQVRVDVVVRDGRVLVRAGDAVDAEIAVGVVVAEAHPQPRGLHKHLQRALGLERLVLGGVEVAHGGVGDVGVDVERRRARGPVAGAFVATDRAPRECGALLAQRFRPRPRFVQSGVTPAQRVAGRVRDRVRQHRQHEGFRVPEGMAVVPGTGQALGRDRPGLTTGTGLQHVEEREPHRLLKFGVAFDLDVGGVPELVEEGSLFGQQSFPAGLQRTDERRLDL